MANEKRERIRMNIFHELYHYYLSEKGKLAIFPLNLININSEKMYALEYLADKGLIRFRIHNGYYTAKITSLGLSQMNDKMLYKKQLVRIS
jgi:hypothetical protein